MRAFLLGAVLGAAQAAAPIASPGPTPAAPTASAPTSTPTSTPTSSPASSPASTPSPGPTSTPAPAQTSAPAPSPATRPPPAPISRASAIEPAGPAPLAPGGETVVDPASSFEVELGRRIVDARIVLLDVADAHVPARTLREVGSTTRLAITPATPLVPGSRYVVRVEGARTRELHDAEAAYAPVSYQLLVAGTPPPPEPKKKPKAKRRVRR